MGACISLQLVLHHHGHKPKNHAWPTPKACWKEVHSANSESTISSTNTHSTQIIKILGVLLRACSRHESREWDEKPDQIHTSRLSSFFMDKTQKADCQSQPTLNLDITTIATDHCLPVLYEHSGWYLTLQFLPECISTSENVKKPHSAMQYMNNIPKTRSKVDELHVKSHAGVTIHQIHIPKSMIQIPSAANIQDKRTLK